MKEKETLTNILTNPIADVKFFSKAVRSVEEQRPSHCAQCGVAVGFPGALRIHGHGLRTRDGWGPASCDAGEAEILEVLVRRFRCVVCRHVMTVLPPIFAPYFRYTVAAIGLALWLWATQKWSEPLVRAEISPLRVWGACDAKRFRSLHRWVRRVGDLFGLPDDLVGNTDRAVARRVIALLVARAPPSGPRARAFILHRRTTVLIESVGRAETHEHPTTWGPSTGGRDMGKTVS